MTNFEKAINAVEENNETNNGQWSDWDDANHIADTYEIDLDEEELGLIDEMIKNNG